MANVRTSSKLYKSRIFETAAMRGRFYVLVGGGSDPAAEVLRSRAKRNSAIKDIQEDRNASRKGSAKPATREAVKNDSEGR